MAVHHLLPPTPVTFSDPANGGQADGSRQPEGATVEPSSSPAGRALVAALLGAAVVSGVFVAVSLPPFGWWPLGLAGFAGFASLVSICRSALTRAAVGAAVGLGQYAIGLWWVNEFSVPGYVLLLVLSMAFTAVASLVVPSRRRTLVLAGLPPALVVVDWLRGHFPFGGLPLGGSALGQVGGPLVAVARLGGPLLVTGIATLAGVALAAAARAAGARVPVARATVGGHGGGAWGYPVPAALLAGVAAVVGVAHLSADGAGTAHRPSIMVAAVQGGGPLGLHAAENDRPMAFQNQLQASALLRPPLQLVLWPEDVITEDEPINQSPDAATVGTLAQRLGATVVAGVVENVGDSRFRNAAVAWAPDGTIIARYDKVHRVPFGEYIPGRGLFQHLANLDLVPRDAIAGHGPGILDTPAGPMGTVISYEVFFQDRARTAVRAGGEVLLVPTNASSYSNSQVPSQEIAAARLEAWSVGRDVIQAAPTGFSALIDADGRVQARTGLGRQQALVGRVSLRDGRTLFVRLGDAPILALAALALVVVNVLARRPG